MPHPYTSLPITRDQIYTMPINEHGDREMILNSIDISDHVRQRALEKGYFWLRVRATPVVSYTMTDHIREQVKQIVDATGLYVPNSVWIRTDQAVTGTPREGLKITEEQVRQGVGRDSHEQWLIGFVEDMVDETGAPKENALADTIRKVRKKS